MGMTKLVAAGMMMPVTSRDVASPQKKQAGKCSRPVDLEG